MLTVCVLLLLMGILGATDIVLFHVIAHRLRERSDSRAELVTHFLRGPTYALLFFFVPNFELRGTWFALLLVLLVFDAVISVVDFWLEPASRKSAGGLPRGEYLLHVVLAGLFGGLVAAVLYEGRWRLGVETGLDWIPFGSGDAPTILRLALLSMSPIVLLTGLLDLRAVVVLGRAKG